MQEFIVGQRWINDAELQLGLGTVIDVEQRMVTILFKAVDETRTYSRQTAPLSRIIFSAGDTVRDDGNLQISVHSVIEKNGLVSYKGKDSEGNDHELDEILLDNKIQLNRPSERLLSYQIDKNKWFTLRYQSLLQLNRNNHSPLRGLLGCRVNLIPHQLYIAHEVAGRYAPRVLLADEVGLGKTIEAGLIIHQQLLTERANRVLIIVPESLIHQWFVELLRRFNLHFSIFDADRYAAITEFESEQNPFQNDQLVLCSLNFLMQHKSILDDVRAGEWDMLVVDEAHHLNWSAELVSSEYKVIEELANVTDSVLLLTATPEQLGKAGHFARLRLLDPLRFPDFENFVNEEKSYEHTADAIQRLLDDDSIEQDLLQELFDLVDEPVPDILQNDKLAADAGKLAALKDELLDKLVDRHGTGRVLFRNTRTAVAGFPERKLHAYPLTLNPAYKTLNFQSFESSLTPERSYAENKQSVVLAWHKVDSRGDWLIDKLNELKPKKVLLICASSTTVLELADCLRLKAGMYPAVFHENMSIVERDRAAAYFADEEEGCQALLCSEIGSEGRNFQFAHHLVFFDLPQNPDLLEQRIGRLDRIGQRNTVNIHVPYFEHSSQEVMLRWLHEGLNAFERPCPAAALLFEHFQSTLSALSVQDSKQVELLLTNTKTLMKDSEESLKKGRDRLLEYNSCRPKIAGKLTRLAHESDKQSGLTAYMEAIFDCFGVHSEEHSHLRYIIRPGDNMLTTFPHLQEEGMTVTYDREIALLHEDVHYLSWDHPMVNSAMDIVLSSELGNTSLIAIEHEGMEAGLLLLECIYIYEASGPQGLQINRYLPATTIRTLVSETGNSLSRKLDYQTIDKYTVNVDRDTSARIVQAKAAELKAMIGYCEDEVKQAAPAMLEKARQDALNLVEREIERLKALSKVNKNVRQVEIDYFLKLRDAIEDALSKAEPRLDALRVIITS